MSRPSPSSVRVSGHLRSPAERVFDAWLSLDARIGGTFSLCYPGAPRSGTGEYLVLDRPRRLVFTWSAPQHAPDLDLVTVHMMPLGDSCDLLVVHELAAAEPSRMEEVRRTWEGMIDHVALALGEAPRPDLPAVVAA